MDLKKYRINKIDYKMLLLSVVLYAIDQLSKIIVVKNIPIWTLPTSENRIRVIGDFLCFIHVRNLGAGFSFGADFSGILRVCFIYVIPFLLMAIVCYAVLGGREKFKFTTLETVFLSFIFAGGMGTMTDRVFRPLGVVDFISVKFYGFLGFDYWPTFNISDSLVVIGVIGMLIAFTINSIKQKKEGNSGLQKM